MIFRYIFAVAVALLLTMELAVADQWSDSVAGTARVIDGDTISNDNSVSGLPLSTLARCSRAAFRTAVPDVWRSFRRSGQ
ncbi:hypothetical protein EGJ57_21210 [Brucella anthropi]|nr:hypothetical protein EGJ57_21210 [Brucella anthropi]